MVHCKKCRKNLEGLPFKCKRCGALHCSKHRLPENHNCPQLRRGNIFETGREEPIDVTPPPKGPDPNKIDVVGERPPEMSSFIDKLKNFTKSFLHKIKRFIFKRSYLDNKWWNYFFINILWITLLSIGLGIVYSNLTKLNDIVLWFIPVGGALLLVITFFWIKYLWKMLKHTRYGYRKLSNWIKFLMLLILLILAWGAYENKDTIFDPLIDTYDKINFTSILPIGISEDIPDKSPFSSKSVNKVKDIVVERIDDVVNPNPLSQKTMEVEQAILKYTNLQRKAKGLHELKWDANLAEIARDHSLDMAENNFFSHDNLKGEDPTDRAKKKGYSVTKPLGGGSFSVGIAENIGKIPTGSIEGRGYVNSDADSIGEAHVDSWMESPGHRQNILGSSYTRIGIGIAYDGLYYVGTQNFY